MTPRARWSPAWWSSSRLRRRRRGRGRRRGGLARRGLTPSGARVPDGHEQHAEDDRHDHDGATPGDSPRARWPRSPRDRAPGHRRCSPRPGAPGPDSPARRSGRSSPGVMRGGGGLEPAPPLVESAPAQASDDEWRVLEGVTRFDELARAGGSSRSETCRGGGGSPMPWLRAGSTTIPRSRGSGGPGLSIPSWGQACQCTAREARILVCVPLRARPAQDRR